MISEMSKTSSNRCPHLSWANPHFRSQVEHENFPCPGLWPVEISPISELRHSKLRCGLPDLCLVLERHLSRTDSLQNKIFNALTFKLYLTTILCLLNHSSRNSLKRTLKPDSGVGLILVCSAQMFPHEMFGGHTELKERGLSLLRDISVSVVETLEFCCCH